MTQPTLFDESAAVIETEKIVLYALGDFQSRKKVLAGRELALDRLRGAFKRACDKFGIGELPDEKLVEALEKLGAKVTEVPPFVAKHPFRVNVPKDVADQAAAAYLSMRKPEEG
jgi:predicted nuclease with RNAse H fold